MKFLSGPAASMGLGGLSFLLTLFFLLSKAVPAHTAAPVEETEETVVTGFWQRHDPEIDQLLDEVKREKEKMAKREAELRELEARLQAERAEISTVTQRVAQIQTEFDQNVTRLKDDEVPNLKRLAKMYNTMTPETVLTILKEMDDQSVVKILGTMKESESAPLLEAMTKQGETQAKRAAGILDAMRKTLPDKAKSP